MGAKNIAIKISNKNMQQVFWWQKTLVVGAIVISVCFPELELIVLCL
jgi:hypothetical protein